MTLARWLAPLLVALTAGPSAQTPERPGGTIRGRVLVPASPTSFGRPAMTDPPTSVHSAANRRRVVVYLERGPTAALGELPAGKAIMNQRAEQFVPRLLAITVGTTVDFPNGDKTFHNVFSLSRTKSFDLGRFPPGKTGAVRFDRPGIVSVFCDIHSHMSAYILVFNHPYFDVSDDDGRYEIPSVPPGDYRLMVWSELGTAAPKRVVVPEGGTADVDFQVGREP